MSRHASFREIADSDLRLPRAEIADRLLRAGVTPHAAIGLVARRNRRIDVIDAQFLLVIVRNSCSRLSAKPGNSLLKGDVILPHYRAKRRN